MTNLTRFEYSWLKRVYFSVNVILNTKFNKTSFNLYWKHPIKWWQSYSRTRKNILIISPTKIWSHQSVLKLWESLYKIFWFYDHVNGETKFSHVKKFLETIFSLRKFSPIFFISWKFCLTFLNWRNFGLIIFVIMSIVRQHFLNVTKFWHWDSRFFSVR